MPSANQLDHTVINVRAGMDTAEALFGALGFTLTERGYHSTGSHNHLMMFGTDYLELLGLPADGVHQRPDLADAPVGINGLVFKTNDADATYAHLQSVGMAGDPPRAFSRPVDLDGESKDAKFRTVTVRPDVFPAGRVYFCEHGTPELVWRTEWQTHDNGTLAMPEFVAVSETPEAEAANFAKLLAGEARDGRIAFDGGVVTVLSPAGYASRYGELASAMNGRTAIFGTLVFRAQARDRLHRALGAGIDGVVSRIEDDRTLVRIELFDALLEFVD